MLENPIPTTVPECFGLGTITDLVALETYTRHTYKNSEKRTQSDSFGVDRALQLGQFHSSVLKGHTRHIVES